MSNIALTTLVILLLVVPGFVARSAYLSSRFTNDVLPKNLSDDIARAFLYSLPFHIAGIGVVAHFHLMGIGVGINIPILFRLVSGDYGKDSVFAPEIIDNLSQYLHQIGLYFIVLVGLAFGTGRALRWWVWRQEWDLKYPSLFGYKTKWLYTLFGRGKTSGTLGKDYLPYVDVIVDLGEKTRMYRGVVSEFTTDDTGTLKDIVLLAALRGKFKKVEEGGSAFYWEEVPGDCLVLRYSEIKNLNVTYVRLPPSSSATQPPSPPEVQPTEAPDPIGAPSSASPPPL